LILAGNGNARITFTRCPFDSGALEICRLFCFHGGRGAVRGLLPGRDLTIIATRYDGDEECAKQIFPMGEESRVWAVEMEVLPPNPPLPEVYADYLTRAYLGEFFLIMVRSSMESPRRHELFQGMAMAMRTRGLQEGLALKGDSKERIAHLMGVIGMRAILAPEGITVTECPFSQAPAEACTLVESFWKGVAASCGSEAEYRHAVTRGDPQCLLCFGKDRPRL
jgi:hypothetical protein